MFYLWDPSDTSTQTHRGDRMFATGASQVADHRGPIRIRTPESGLPMPDSASEPHPGTDMPTAQ
jgi:hypothetical protein